MSLLLKGECNALVAETHRYNVGRRGGQSQQRCVSVPQIVVPDPSQLGVADESVEALGYNVDIVGASVLASEHEVRLMPLALVGHPFFELSPPPLLLQSCR